MILDIDKLVNSNYVYCEFGKWKIDNQAPEEIKKEFNTFIQNLQFTKTEVEIVKRR